MDEWCPTAAGTMGAYAPEYYDTDREKWRAVPVSVLQNSYGVPWPVGAALLAHVDLYGHEQAMALAWTYAAHEAARHGFAPKIRVQKYEFVYDIKARKTEVVP